MAVDIKVGSRMQLSKLLIVDGIEFWDTAIYPDSSTFRKDDIIHVVSQNDRIDLIAYQYYQDPTMWWVIAWANDLEILPTSLKENDKLKIPSKDFVLNSLLKPASRSQ